MFEEGTELGAGVRIERIIEGGTRLNSYQQLMGDTFDPDTLDPIEETAATCGENDPQAQLILLACIDTHEQVVAALSASYLAACDEKGTELGWYLLIINYIACAKSHQGKGLAKSLYNSLEQEVKILESHQRPLRLVLGETDPDVEGLVNKMPYKRRRLFALQSDGTFKELPYEQPPHGF